MPVRYISISDRVSEDNDFNLINDFVQSTNDKYIVIRKVRLINDNGQLDVGCCLCGNFADDSSYSYGLFDDYIMCTNEFNENHTSTIQANYKVKPIIVSNDAYAKLNIWDTCGNEKFRAITRQYYKDVQGIILVYDISNRESFESIDSWIEDIKNCAPANSVIILTGNKSDLDDKREVSYKEGKDKADELGYLFNEASAKNGENILLLFANLTEAMMEQLEKDKSESLAIGKQTLQSIRLIDDSVLSNKREMEKEKEKKCC